MTSEQKRTSASEADNGRLPDRPSTRRIPVRMKLVAVLALPMLLLLALGAARVLDAQGAARDAERESDLAQGVVGPGSLLGVLTEERNHTAVHLLGAEDMITSVPEDGYLTTRESVDEAMEEFLDIVEDGGQLQEIYQPAIDGLDQLDDVRAAVDNSQTPRDLQNVAAVEALFEDLNGVLDPMFEANREVRMTLTDVNLQRGVALVDQASRQTNAISLLTYQLAVAALAGDSDGVNTSEEFVAVSSLLRDLRTGEGELTLYGQGPYQEYVDAVFASSHTARFPELVEEALDTGAPDLGGLFANAGDEDAYGYDNLREDAEQTVKATADSIASDASETQLYFMIAAGLVLVLVAIVTALVAVSITRPLRDLTRQATAMAEERLPRSVQRILETPPGENISMPNVPPVTVHTRDEVAEVANALTSVQDSALSLAVEQAALRRNIADSFVNLGRRNQSLLGRQLDFITELEQNEADPQALSNLFKLDHLATRMRRNAESLLVLAGVEPARKWTAPVRLTDVVRAALGEVEDYQRVTVRGVEPATVIGAVAADLAHLLAELIENALTFSPPDQPVEIRGRFTALPTALPGSSNEEALQPAYTLAVVDSGLGMAADDIERANRRLAGEESFTIAPSKYLGHYVAGMVAVRHGIQVQLQSSPQRGLTATLALPQRLLSSQEAPGLTAPSGIEDEVAPTGLARALGKTAIAPPELTAGGAGTPDSAYAPQPGEITSPAYSPSPYAPPQFAPEGPYAPASPQVPQMPQVPQGPQMPQMPVPGEPQPIPTIPLTTGAPAGQLAPTTAAINAQPGTYRIGETEYSIDLGTSASPDVNADNDERDQLIQRIQGAQMPQTQLASLSRAPATAPTPVTPPPRAPAPPVDDEARAGHVRSFLSSFSSGLEQGRDAAAREQSGDIPTPPE